MDGAVAEANIDAGMTGRGASVAHVMRPSYLTNPCRSGSGFRRCIPHNRASRTFDARGRKPLPDRHISDHCPRICAIALRRSEEHTSELQSLIRIYNAVFCLKKKKKKIIL